MFRVGVREDCGVRCGGLRPAWVEVGDALHGQSGQLGTGAGDVRATIRGQGSMEAGWCAILPRGKSPPTTGHRQAQGSRRR